MWKEIQGKKVRRESFPLQKEKKAESGLSVSFISHDQEIRQTKHIHCHRRTGSEQNKQKTPTC